MTRDNRNKLNRLLKEWIPNTVYLATVLKNKKISQQLTSQYVQAKWIERIGPGAFIRFNDKVDWTGGLYAMQNQANLPVYPGGKTALELHGYTHSLSLGTNSRITLLSFKNIRLPKWFINHNWGINILFKKFSIFSSPLVGLTTLYFESGYSIKLSCPEQAMIEVCNLIPNYQAFEEAKHLMQGLLTLRPIRLQELLENGRSVKAKRIFLYLAEYCNMPWFNKLCLEKLYLGKGKRQVIEGGYLDSKYQITVPKDTPEITLNDIP